MGVPITSELPNQWKQWEGQVVGGTYRLEQYLAGSDQSAIFLTAREGRKAAVKVFPSDLARAQRLVEQWQQVSTLSHPHLMRIFDCGQSQIAGVTACYVVMEYGEEDLSQILPQRALTPTETRDMLRQVSAALAYLHGKGFVHGHIKPSNILALDDQVKISSDSVCRIGNSDDCKPPSTVYDPPERDSAGLSPVGDVWSLGITLIESLTRRPSAWTTTAQGEPILREVLPAPFDDIARHCLQGDPSRRWTILEVERALAPPSAQPQRPVVGTAQTNLAKRLAIPIIAVLLLAIVVGPKLFRRSEGPPSAPDKSATSVPSTNANPPEVSARPAQSQAQVPSTTTAAGSVLHEALPNVSASARRTITGTIRVRAKVAVDASGNVTKTSLVSAGPSKYFARLSSEAVRSWKFTPPRVSGENVASEWTILFEFRRTQTHAVPEQVKP